MQYMGVSRMSLVIAMAASFLWSQGALLVAKEADELEEALMVKLLEKRAKKRTGDDDSSASRLTKSDLKFLKSDDKSEVSVGVVNDVKGILKEPFLTLLASSELISWTELSSRVSAAKKALEMFEVKYRSELASGGKVAGFQAPVGGVVMPGANKAAMPGTSAVMPGVNKAVMPGTMPGVRTATMPGVAAKIAAKKPADDDDEEDEDEAPVKPKVAGMPGIAAKPAGMPGVVMAAPAGMPGVPPVAGGMPGVAAPIGMPGVAPIAGGMPMAR